jgi:hypothetical protein
MESQCSQRLDMVNKITLLATGDQETPSLTDHETCGVDLDMNGTLNDVKYLPFRG